MEDAVLQKGSTQQLAFAADLDKCKGTFPPLVTIGGLVQYANVTWAGGECGWFYLETVQSTNRSRAQTLD